MAGAARAANVMMDLLVMLCGDERVKLKFVSRFVIALVSSPDPTPQIAKEEEGLVTFERFLGSCKLSILTFAKANQIAAPRFSCDLASGRTATIVQCQLAV